MPAKFTTPAPFAEATARLAQQQVLPTHLGSAELSALGGKWHRKTSTSARTLIVDLLDAYKEKAERIIFPTQVIRDTGEVVTEGLNFAKAREEIKTLQQSLGLAKGDGSVADLTSDKRINLKLQTDVAVAQGEGYFVQGQAAATLDEFPAQELYRVEPRKEHRDWAQRWRIAAAVAGDVDAARVLEFSGRMIARKDSAIWLQLGEGAGGYSDGLGNPFEPFAFNSGMGTRDIARDEAEELGVVRPGQVIAPQKLEDLP